MVCKMLGNYSYKMLAIVLTLALGVIPWCLVLTGGRSSRRRKRCIPNCHPAKTPCSCKCVVCVVLVSVVLHRCCCPSFALLCLCLLRTHTQCYNCLAMPVLVTMQLMLFCNHDNITHCTNVCCPYSCCKIPTQLIQCNHVFGRFFSAFQM